MRFRLLLIFIAVCEEESMTKAAKRLYISQPSISQAISELEAHYGVRLFERLSHKLYLTRAGKQLLSYAYHIAALNQEMEDVMAHNLLKRSIKLGATVTIGTYLLPHYLARLKAADDDFEINVTVDNTEYIAELILNSKLDLGLIEGKVTAGELVTKPFYEDELVIICHKANPLVKKRQLTTCNLCDQTFLVREPGSGSRALFVEAMNRGNIPFGIGGVFNNTEAIINSTLSGLGLGVVSKISIPKNNPDVVVLPIANFQMKRKFSVVYHRDKFLNAELLKVIDELVTAYQYPK